MNDPAYDQIPLSAPSQVVPLSYAPPVLVAPRDIIPATAVPAAAHEMYPPPAPARGRVWQQRDTVSAHREMGTPYGRVRKVHDMLLLLPYRNCHGRGH